MKHFTHKLISSAALSLVMAGAAQAATIEGAINVDNDFVVVHSQGNSHNVIYRGQNQSNWDTTETFKVNVDDDENALKQCSINVIAWGDGSSRQGFAGIIKGNNGTAYTGSSKIKARQTSIPTSGWAISGTTPTQTQINTMLAAPATATPHVISSSTVTQGGGTAPWGAMSYSGSLMSGVNASNFRWIWSTPNVRKQTFSVFKMACGDLVKPKKTWDHMPGEHFQCYNLEKGDRLKPEEITVRDQFGRSKVVLGTPRMLCNPSEKIHRDTVYKIENEKRHLVCYNYVKQGAVKPQKLRINNQFAPDDVVSTRRAMFCVPSSKKHLDRIVNPRPRPRKDLKARPKLNQRVK